MTLAAHVATLGRGPGRSRSLTQDEAFEAMTLMLDGAAPEAVGALLMLLRMKGETAEEIAGLAAAAQAALPDMRQADLDWPCYAAGRTRGAPWFLLSARLVAQTGHRVVLHGYNGNDAAVRDHLDVIADVPNLEYLPLETLHPALFDLLALRPVLGLRSCINTVCRLLIPARAAASVQGVFHPSYRLLQADAAQRLGWQSLTVIKGGGGEFERLPGKQVEAFGLRQGTHFDGVFPALTGPVRLAEVAPDISPQALWDGTASDPAAEAVVVGTAALALDTLGYADALTHARSLWAARHHPQETAA